MSNDSGVREARAAVHQAMAVALPLADACERIKRHLMGQGWSAASAETAALTFWASVLGVGK